MASPSRTPEQNNGMHVFFANLAENLNGAGLDMRKVLKPGVDIPWNATTVKEHLWRPIQKAQFHKQSTTELNTKEVGEVYETLIRHLGEKFGISEPFPVKEEYEKAEQKPSVEKDEN